MALAAVSYTGDVAVSGDVFIGGAADTTVTGAQYPGGVVTRLAANGGGIVWRTTVTPEHDLAVVKLAAADGDELWRHVVDGSGARSPDSVTERATTVAMHPSGPAG